MGTNLAQTWSGSLQVNLYTGTCPGVEFPRNGGLMPHALGGESRPSLSDLGQDGCSGSLTHSCASPFKQLVIGTLPDALVPAYARQFLNEPEALSTLIM